MRPKVAAAILMLGFGVFGVAILISRTFNHGWSDEAAANPPVAQTQPSIAPGNESFAYTPSVIVNDRATVAFPPVVSEADHAVYVCQRVNELMALAMNHDPSSLDRIWSDLSNPDKEIRAGALAAVVQFGDRSVTPRLRELAAQTKDPYEKVDILAAADQLDLPPLGEVSFTP